MRSASEPISPYRVAIVFPADAERRQKTRLEDSRFARTAAALAEKGIAVEDATLPEAGMVGLWTKADSVTVFNGFTYGERR